MTSPSDRDPPPPGASAPERLGSEFFVFRTPALPFDEFLHWGEGLEAPSEPGDMARLELALAADRRQLRSRMRRLLARPEVTEALFVASPSLHAQLGDWWVDPDGESGAKVERALVRYLSRMMGRPTPFGLFAGLSVGVTGAETRIRMVGREGYRRQVRLDTDPLAALANTLAADAQLQNRLRYWPNTTCYSLSTHQLRYIEARFNGVERTYREVGIRSTPHLRTLLARAARGATRDELATALEEAQAVERSAAEAYVDELCRRQVLQSELALSATGPEPLDHLIDRLEALSNGHGMLQSLLCVRQLLSELNASSPGLPPARYQALTEMLRELPGLSEQSAAFQVDLHKPGEGAVLGPQVHDELSRGTRLLHRISRSEQADGLGGLRAEFARRFGDQAVALMEALDEDSGLDMDSAQHLRQDASPLLAELPFPEAKTDELGPINQREAVLLRKFERARATGATRIELTEADLAALEVPDRLPLPDAFSVHASLAAGSQEALARGDFQLLLESVYGPSGATLLGRFCHADPELTAHVERHLRAEEALRPDAVFAEVAFLGGNRVGNVVLRPALRTHEIPYLARPSVPEEGQLAIGDLWLSVEQGRFVLRSARLGREVIPRLTCAHNFRDQRLSRLYKFLGMLQEQAQASNLRWNWGALRHAAFLPRVTAGRLVLCRARWILQPEQWRPIFEACGAARYARMKRLAAELGLPRYVTLTQGTDYFPVDLDNVLSFENAVQLLGDVQRPAFFEMFPDPEHLCAEGPEGRFVHELLVPFVRQCPPSAPSPPRAPAPVVPRSARSFAPGSEWLFTKLYSGRLLADDVLREVVAPIARRALASGAADQWFFIRYADPDWHLRFRLHGPPGRLASEVLPALYAALAPWLESGTIHRVQFDTYEREVERYGGLEGMLLAESLFQADSEAVVDLLRAPQGEAGLRARWLLALQGIHRLLLDFGLELEERRLVVRSARAQLGALFKLSPEFDHRLGMRYRRERRTIEALLAPGGGVPTPLRGCMEILDRRGVQLGPVVAGLRERARSGKLTVPLEEFANSAMHMFTNRVLRTHAREQELVLYDFLSRLYDSQLARSRVGR
ncbi:lantibiotic dehydratase [Corallococcus silvisoli]|uniref:lantibiotic dehydratase n=1 Tax=Corallococcus silvisoli TaxID=2697031 RepID=UPI0013779D9B|nr:lantibiotic dehydratase [Corallococcus silvisoli]NBD12967.1 Lanthionine biosynthesis protein LanB [Corallococcus silvisoli]